MNDPGVKAERQHFLEHCRRRSDEDLLTVLGVRPAAVAATSEPPRVSSLPGLLGAVKAGDLPAPVVERWKRAATWHAGVVQHPGELAVVFQRLQADPPKRLLEVGSEGGGSLYIYAGACAPGARLVAVDDGRHAGRAATLERTIAALRAEGFEVHWIRGDSHAAATRKQAVDALSGAPDFVHIDGDHRTAGALQDWRDYGALARAGGLVALHDIDYPRGGVGAAWREIAASGFAVETIKLGVVGGHAPMGVGLVRMAAPLPREPKIDVRIAYEPGGRIGADYNRIMRETPHEWVLLLDHDVLLLHPSWYEVCQRAVREHPDAGLLTCWTNNIACKHQLDAGAPRTADLAAHRARARELWLQHQFACTLNAKWLISGFFMLTCKRAWTKAGGFPEDGFFGVDNEYDRRVRHAGFTTYRIDGLYCYHIRERRDRDWIAGVPTSATLASQRTAVEISRSTAPIGVPA